MTDNAKKDPNAQTQPDENTELGKPSKVTVEIASQKPSRVSGQTIAIAGLATLCLILVTVLATLWATSSSHKEQRLVTMPEARARALDIDKFVEGEEMPTRFDGRNNKGTLGFSTFHPTNPVKALVVAQHLRAEANVAYDFDPLPGGKIEMPKVSTTPTPNSCQ